MENTTTDPIRSDPIIRINCGGTEFWTLKSTLKRNPGSVLNQMATMGESHPAYRAELNCYFFDRDPGALSSVLDFYRTGELHLEDSICGNAMRSELEFWGINEGAVEPCCWGEYAKFHNHKETLNDLESIFGAGDEVCLRECRERLKSPSRWIRFQTRIWIKLEYPSESLLAKVVMVASVVFVLLSIIETVLESHYIFKVVNFANGSHIPAPNPNNYMQDTNCERCCTLSYDNVLSMEDYPITIPHPILDIMDDIFVAYFVLEFLIRLIFSPNKIQFFKSPLNFIDFICVVPQLTSTIIEHLHTGGTHTKRASDILKAITVLRAVRVLRVFKLMKHYSAFKILAYTVKAYIAVRRSQFSRLFIYSTRVLNIHQKPDDMTGFEAIQLLFHAVVSIKELLLMIVHLMTLVLIFASVIHYVEEDNFSSIPIGLWWALVTMTTVGYGDKHPKKTAGYIVGSLCVICGMLVIAFTVPIVVNNFTLYYTHAKTRTKLPKKGSIKRKVRDKSIASSLGNDFGHRKFTSQSSNCSHDYTMTSDIVQDEAFNSNGKPNGNPQVTHSSYL